MSQWLFTLDRAKTNPSTASLSSCSQMLKGAIRRIKEAHEEQSWGYFLSEGQLVKYELFVFYPRFSLIHDLFLLRKERVRKYTAATEPLWKWWLSSLDEIFQLPEKYPHDAKTWVWSPVLISNMNRIKLCYENQKMQVCPQIYFYWFLSRACGYQQFHTI